MTRVCRRIGFAVFDISAFVFGDQCNAKTRIAEYHHHLKRALIRTFLRQGLIRFEDDTKARFPA